MQNDRFMEAACHIRQGANDSFWGYSVADLAEAIRRGADKHLGGIAAPSAGDQGVLHLACQETPVAQVAMPPLVGVCGAIGSGKDTVAEIMASRWGTVRRSFADPVRQAACTLFPLHLHDCIDRVRKERSLPELGDRSPRKVLQVFGTEICRDFDADIWVRSMEARIRTGAMRAPSESTVIPDVRFENEADFVRGNGGRMVFIFRPGCDSVIKKDHASENGIAFRDGDIRIINDGTIEELYAKVIAAVGAPVNHASRRPKP